MKLIIESPGIGSWFHKQDRHTKNDFATAVDCLYDKSDELLTKNNFYELLDGMVELDGAEQDREQFRDYVIASVGDKAQFAAGKNLGILVAGSLDLFSEEYGEEEPIETMSIYVEELDSNAIMLEFNIW